MSKTYIAKIIDLDPDGGITVATRYSDLTDKELAAILWAVVDDVINQMGKSKEELIEILKECYN